MKFLFKGGVMYKRSCPINIGVDDNGYIYGSLVELNGSCYITTRFSTYENYNCDYDNFIDEFIEVKPESVKLCDEMEKWNYKEGGK